MSTDHGKIAKGVRAAQELTETEGAFEAVKQALFTQWVAGADPAARELLHAECRVLERVRQRLIEAVTAAQVERRINQAGG